MKYAVIFVLALFALANAEEWKRKNENEVKAIAAECLKEAPLSRRNIKKIMQHEDPEIKSVKKFILCTYSKMGFFSREEGFHADRMAVQDFTDEESVKEINACVADKNEQGSPIEEWVFRVHKCLNLINH